MQYPYGLHSDEHCHAWSAFSTVDADGVNSRLRAILNENERCAAMVKKAGGNRVYMAGDLFHVKGEIKPSVFNPTEQSFRKIAKVVDVEAIPGNHDLEGNDADALGNAIQSLSNIEGFNVHVEPTLVGDVLMIPWFRDLNHLRALLASQAAAAKHGGWLEKTDVIIHAPLNGVLKGLPDHGLDPEELAAYGFRRVFCGHYHNHKVFCGGKVISIGATTHQTWSDPGTTAGFLLIYPDRIEHVPTKAPQFIDVDVGRLEGMEDLMELVNGNYARIKLNDAEPKDIKAWRDDALKAGAAGVQIIVNKTASVTRSGAGAKASVSLEASVTHYIEKDLRPTLLAEVQKEALDVLAEAKL